MHSAACGRHKGVDAVKQSGVDLEPRIDGRLLPWLTTTSVLLPTAQRSECGRQPGQRHHDYVAKPVAIVIDGMSVDQKLLVHLSTVIDLELSYLSTLFG
ncbi:hypothetical protein [Streptomyces sp. SD31]|uniref:hypothetical protein n=1 Tax=Streptomyces sp. SD31 TaxID=3452208 RepID=UPI003F8AE7F3